MHTKNDIPVNVVMIAYNHEAFVGQAIESIMNQVADFNYVLTIAEDCSTDNTRKVCEEYADKYREKIILLPSDRNYGSQGNFVRVLLTCTSNYIAVCEGDDYWIDDKKLQKQYDMLEADPSKILCFTRSLLVDQNSNTLGEKTQIPVKDTHTLEDVLRSGKFYMPTATFFFRNIIKAPAPAYFANAISGDIALVVLLLNEGDAVCLYEMTAAYRIHAGGVSKSEEHIRKGDMKQFELYEDADIAFNHKYPFFKEVLFDRAKTLLYFGARDLKGMERQKYILKYLGKYFKYQQSLNVKETLQYIYVLYFVYFTKKLKGQK